MAHSDALIFLTNISWIFFLFLFCYFFFVTFFLPTFYKKVRARTLIRGEQQRFVLILLANSIVGASLFVRELTRAYFLELSLLTAGLTFGLKNSANSFQFRSLNLAKSESSSLITHFALGSTSVDSSTKLISCFEKFAK